MVRRSEKPGRSSQRTGQHQIKRTPSLPDCIVGMIIVYRRDCRDCCVKHLSRKTTFRGVLFYPSSYFSPPPLHYLSICIILSQSSNCWGFFLFILLSPSLSLYLSHTHTETHTVTHCSLSPITTDRHLTALETPW